MDFDALTAAITRPTHSTRLCLRSDLFAKRARIIRELARLSQEDSLAGSRSTAEADILARLDKVDDEMNEATTEFVFTALPRSEFTALEDAFPFEDDAPTRDFLAALIAGSLTDPDVTLDQAKELLELLSDGQAQVLEDAAWSVNRDTSSLDF